MTSTDLRPADRPTRHGAPIAVTGWAAVTPVGVGSEPFTDAVMSGKEAFSDPTDLFDLELPAKRAGVLRDFHARHYLGRKGTSFLDRSSALGLVGSHLALKETSLDPDLADRDRLGIVLGTTSGGVKAIVDFSNDTLEDPPYMVQPLLFPNTVMNSAAGQAGIHLKLFGPNSTVVGGVLSSLQSLRYGMNLLRNGYADGLVVGAYEEFTPQTAWIDHASRGGDTALAPLGEGAVAFVLEDAEAVRASGRAPDAEILTVESRTGPPLREDAAGMARLLADAISRALERSGVSADDIWAVSSAEGGTHELDAVENDGIVAALGEGPERIRAKEQFGECGAASGGLQLATVLARHRHSGELDGAPSVVTSLDPEGAVNVAVVRGWTGGGRDHR